MRICVWPEGLVTVTFPASWDGPPVSKEGSVCFEGRSSERVV